MAVTASALNSALASLARTFDQLADNFYVTDSDGHFLHVNPAFEQTTGYTLAEVVGKTPSILKSGIHPRQVYAELWESLKNGVPFRFIFTNRKKNGDLYEEGVLISPIRDENGEITNFICIGRVIDQFRQTYDVFTLLADASPISMFVLQNGRFFYLNKAFLGVTGYEAAELLEADWTSIIHEADRAEALRLCEERLAGRRNGPVEFRVTCKNGETRWVLLDLAQAQFRGIPAVSGQFVAGSFVDITARKKAEHAVKQALSLYAATIESTTDGIVITDLEGDLIGYNRRFLDMWRLPNPARPGVSPQDVLAAQLDQVIDADGFRSLIEEAFRSLDGEFESLIELRDGRFFELHSRPQLIESTPAGRVWAFRDVTEHKRLEAKLQYLASHDPLTGVPNRRYFQEELERQLAGNGRGAVLFLDLDSFKQVNDRYGHSAGDEILRTLIRSLYAATGSDDLLARLGGDELGVILKDAGPDRAEAEAQRLLRLASASGAEQSPDIACTLSIGCALFPEHGHTMDDLLKRADTAMYEVKQAGGNGFRIFQTKR